MIEKGDIELKRARIPILKKNYNNIFPETSEERIALLGPGELFGEECVYSNVIDA